MELGALCEALATVLSYPGEDYPERVQRCAHVLRAANAEMPFADFAAYAREHSVNELQELFIQTFDLNPVCALELGWQLFGENYDRGAFLVRMRQELRRYGIAESQELPDHVTHALLLLGRMEPPRAADFATACVLPALEKMLAALRGKQNPYENVLQAVARLLRDGCGVPDGAFPAEPETAFHVLE